MTDEQINKRIHEIMGLCWHSKIRQRDVPVCNDEGKIYGEYLEYYCVDCNEQVRGLSSPVVLRHNFTGNWQTSAYEFGLLWEWLQKHERCEEFWDWVYEKAGLLYNQVTSHREMPSSYFWMVYLTGIMQPDKCLISPPTLSRAAVEFFND